MSTILALNAQENVNSSPLNSAKWKKGDRYDFKFEMTLSSIRDSIFPLLCPIREYEWLNDWKCTMIYSESGIAENNGIFYVKMGFPLFKKQVFQVINYVPNENITFLIFLNNLTTLKFSLTLESVSDSSTKLTLDYKLTGLSGFGNLFLKKNAKKIISKNAELIESDLRYWLINDKKRPKNYIMN